MQVDRNGPFSLQRYDVEAPFYDLIFNQTNDIPYYLKYASKSKGEILECACGTGRITIPLARAGHKVTGIDLNDKMLAMARAKVKMEEGEVRKRVRLLKGDMRSFAPSQRFGLCLIPFFSFQHLLTPEDVAGTLSSVQGLLAPGGRLVFNVFNPDLKRPEGVQRLEAVVDGPKGRIMRYSVQWFDKAKHLTYGWNIYDFVRQNGTVTRKLSTFRLRYFFKGEVEALLSSTGFVLESVLGDYEGNQFEKKSPMMSFVSRKARRPKVSPTS